MVVPMTGKDKESIVREVLRLLGKAIVRIQSIDGFVYRALQRRVSYKNVCHRTGIFFVPLSGMSTIFRSIYSRKSFG